MDIYTYMSNLEVLHPKKEKSWWKIESLTVCGQICSLLLPVLLAYWYEGFPAVLLFLELFFFIEPGLVGLLLQMLKHLGCHMIKVVLI